MFCVFGSFVEVCHGIYLQPYIHVRWSIFTFPGHNEPRPGHGTPWVNSGTIPAIPGRLATLGYRPISLLFTFYITFTFKTVKRKRQLGADRLTYQAPVHQMLLHPTITTSLTETGSVVQSQHARTCRISRCILAMHIEI